VALLLTSKSHAKDFPQKPAHVAFIDADNDGVRALDRMPSPKPTAPTSTAWSFHRARRAGSRAW